MSGFPVTFSHPIWLLLLALIPLAWWLERRSLVLLPTGRRWLSFLLRVLIILLLILGLAGVRIQRASDKLTVIFAIDRSESISDAESARALQTVNAALATRRMKDDAGVIVFGDDALVERVPGPMAPLPKLESAPNRSYTDLSKAIRLAVGLFPEGSQRRLVLLTDGNENLGNSLTDANIAAANDIPIDVVSLKTDRGEEVVLENVIVPEKVDKNRTFEVKIVARSTYSGKATLRLYRDRNVVGQNEVQLTEGKNIFVLPQEEKDAGFHTYEAMIDTPRDSLRDNNQAGAYTVVYGESRVLLVGDEPDTRYLREAFKVEKVPVEVAESPPSSAADAENYDAIFLCNYSGERMGDAQMKLLQAYCGDLGGGLAMIGGENSFGLGGYRHTPVEEAMPVTMEIKNKKNFPSLGIVVLVDKSGSMSEALPCGKSKLELAAEAAVAASEMLTDRDSIGVIGFDSAAKWDCPFQNAGDKRHIQEYIRSLRPGGGTDAIPAFNEAIRVLGGAQLQLKHVIFISDGMVMPGDYERVVKELNSMRATITTIAIGTDADKNFMERIAQQSGGRFYFTDDPSRVPRIFTKETVLAQRSYMIEENFTPTLSQSNEISKGLGAFPVLHGYVSTEQKDRAEIVLKSHKGDPVLATWRYRMGKALAWTSDAKDRWASDWLGWEEFKKFWGQSARWVMRNKKEGALHPHVVLENGVGKVTVDAVSQRGEFVNFLNLDTSVITPGFQSRQVKLRQTAAGHYEGEFEAKEVGTYLASVSGDKVDPATAGASVSYPPEYLSSRSNHLLLSQLAAATGGKIDPLPRDIFRRDNQRIRSIHELWYHMLWLALLLFLADIAVRRVFLDAEQKEQLAAFARKMVPFANRTASAGAGETLDALKRRRRHVQESLQPTVTYSSSVELKPVATDVTSTTATARTSQAGAQVASKPVEAVKPAQAPKASSADPADETHTSRLLEARRKARERTERR